MAAPGTAGCLVTKAYCGGEKVRVARGLLPHVKLQHGILCPAAMGQGEWGINGRKLTVL
jgi:hypothetical protein